MPAAGVAAAHADHDGRDRDRLRQQRPRKGSGGSDAHPGQRGQDDLVQLSAGCVLLSGPRSLTPGVTPDASTDPAARDSMPRMLDGR